MYWMRLTAALTLAVISVGLAACVKNPDINLQCEGSAFRKECVLRPSGHYLGIALGMTKEAVYRSLCSSPNAHHFFDLGSFAIEGKFGNPGDTASVGAADCKRFDQVKPADHWYVHSDNGTCIANRQEDIVFEFTSDRLISLKAYCETLII